MSGSTRRLVLRAIAPVLALAVLVAACGSGDDDTTEAGGDAPVTTTSTAPAGPAQPTQDWPVPTVTTLPPVEGAPPERVALLGDSILDQVGPLLVEYADPTYDVQVWAVPRKRIDEQTVFLAEILEWEPRQVVIHLGTNDVMQQWPYDQSILALQLAFEAINRAGSVECVHLLTVNERMLSQAVPDSVERATQLNNQIRVLAPDYRVRVIEWAAQVQAANQANEYGPLFSDYIHPTPAGEVLMVQTMLDALAECPAAGEGEPAPAPAP